MDIPKIVEMSDEIEVLRKIVEDYSDDVTIESAFTKIGRSSFEIEHKLFKKDALCLEGFEIRVWVGRDPNDPTKIKSKPIPDELVARFRAGS